MSDAAARPSSQGVGTILLGMAVGVAAAFVMSAAKVPAEYASVIVPSVGLLPPAIADWLYKRRRGRREELASLSHGDLVRPALLIVAIVAGTQLLIVQVVAFVAGFCVGIGLAVAFGSASLPADAAAYGSGLASLFVAYPIAVIAAHFLARRACHYLGRHPYRWLLAAVALFAALQVALDAALMARPTVESAFISAGWFALTYASMASGAWFGLRRRREFLAGRLLRKLPPEDLLAVTELIRESVATRLRSSAPEPAPTPEA